MAPRKNGFSQRFESQTQPTDLERTPDDEKVRENGSTMGAYEENEPDADFDDGELTDEDFAVDDDEQEEDI